MDNGSRIITETGSVESAAESGASLLERLERLEAGIEAACRAAGRRREEIELMAVSKTYPATDMAQAARLGLRLFGENRVQEFAGKNAELAAMSAETGSVRDGARVHLIGHLQSNKAQRAVEVFDGVDSLDSLKLAERLHEAMSRLEQNHDPRARKSGTQGVDFLRKSALRSGALGHTHRDFAPGARLPVLLEIKLSQEPTKAGLDPYGADLEELLERLPDLSNLEPRGLMTIAPFGVSDEATRDCFRQLRQLRDAWSARHPRLNLETLSMGMSGDYPLAIAEGATRIRVGTALFGKRA